MPNTRLLWERRFAGLVVVGQTVIWLRAPQASAADHIHQAFFVLSPLLLVFLTFRRDYARLRLAIIPILRIVGHLLSPRIRRAEVGSAGLLLGKPPLPGAAGAALDTFRVLTATRLLPQAIITLAFRLPLPLAAVTLAAALCLQSNSSAYCRTELLAHPVTRARMVDLWWTFDATSQVFIHPFGTMVHRPSPAAACATVLNFATAASGIVSVAALVYLQPRQPAQPQADPAQPGAPGWQADDAWPPPPAAGARDGRLSAGWRWLDRALQAAFFADGLALQRACAVLLILHAAWLAAKAAT